MHRSFFWSLAWFLGAMPAWGVASEAPPSPNLILILADDLGWGDLGFHGRTDWETPHLDRLAEQGTVFDRSYAAAAACAPSRATLLTGKNTIHCGVRRNEEDLPAEEVTIAEALRSLGYATAAFGKWHHGRPRPGHDSYVHPIDQGFDNFFGFTDSIHAWEKFPTVLWEGRQRVPVSGYADDLFTDRAVEFLRSHSDRPFFLYLPYTAPHFAIAAPAEEVNKHQGRLPEADPSRSWNATYAAMVTRLDAHVGRILEELDRLGLAESTLLVFTSDHGATFEMGNQGTSNALDSNRPFRGQKRTLWEGGIRVPTVARWHGQIPAGVVSQEPHQLIDLFPTFLAAAGSSPDPAWGVDGVNLLPAWTRQEPAPDRTLFWEWRSEGADQIAAMRGNLKLVAVNGGTPELFDVEADPAERRNVAAEHPENFQQLLQELHSWLETEINY